MDSRYGFICGALKPNEKQLLNDDDKKRFQAAENFEDIFRASAETFFGSALSSVSTFDEAIKACEQDVGKFVAHLYVLPGGEAAALAVYRKFFEAIRIGIYGMPDERIHSCGFNIPRLLDKADKHNEPYFLSEIRESARKLKEEYKAGGFTAFESLIFYEQMKFAEMLAKKAGGFALTWYNHIQAGMDAVALIWFLRIGKCREELSARLQNSSSIVCKYYSEVQSYHSKKTQGDTGDYYTSVIAGISGENSALGQLSKELLRAQSSEEVEFALKKYENLLLRNALYAHTDSMYVIWFIRTLFSDLEFVRKHIFRVIMNKETLPGGVVIGAA